MPNWSPPFRGLDQYCHDHHPVRAVADDSHPAFALSGLGTRTCAQLWTLSLVGWLINCTITASYHFPVVWTSMQGGYSAAEMSGVVDSWVLVHWVRIALGYLTFFSALLATMRGRVKNLLKRNSTPS